MPASRPGGHKEVGNGQCGFVTWTAYAELLSHQGETDEQDFLARVIGIDPVCVRHQGGTEATVEDRTGGTTATTAGQAGGAESTGVSGAGVTGSALPGSDAAGDPRKDPASPCPSAASSLISTATW